MLRALRLPILRGILSLPFTQVFADLTTFAQLDRRAIVVVANHVCVYDSALVILACETQRREVWLAAARSVLEQFPALHRLGAFAVAGGTPLASAKQLREVGARASRSAPGRAVVVFPEAGHVRPGLSVDVQRGALALAHAADAPIVPVALHYEMFERARPFAYLRAGAPCDVARPSEIDLRVLLDEARAALMRDLLEGTGAYEALLRGRPETVLVANVPLDRRRIGRSLSPLYRQLACLKNEIG